MLKLSHHQSRQCSLVYRSRSGFRASQSHAGKTQLANQLMNLRVENITNTSDAVITGCAVAQHCYKGDQPFQWEIPKFESPYISNPLTFEHQIWHRECMMALQGHPRSLILVSIEIAYATSYWWTMVVNSNLGPILPLFKDIAGFLRRRATPPLFHRILGVFPFN